MFESVPLWMMIVGFLLVLGPLITVHELGHYLVGRFFGVKADVFSVGFGKELTGWTDKRGTRWRISSLPLGGYVQFAGDMNPASQPSPEWLALPEKERNRTFQSKPLWQRSLIVLAGPLTNFIVAIVILAGLAMMLGKPVVEPVVGSIMEGSAAAEAGIEPGDRIVRADGVVVDDFSQLSRRVTPNPGNRIELTIERDGREIAFDFVIPTVIERDRFGNESRIGRLGIGSDGGHFEAVGPVQAVGEGFRQTGEIVSLMVNGIWQIITGRRSVQELGGPVKIAKFSGEHLSLGWGPFIWFVAAISINLGFINLLPIPALDGGHLAFYAAEAVRRKPLGPRSQEWAFRTGVAFVLALMLFVTINDIASLPIFGS